MEFKAKVARVFEDVFEIHILNESEWRFYRRFIDEFVENLNKIKKKGKNLGKLLSSSEEVCYCYKSGDGKYCLEAR